MGMEKNFSSYYRFIRMIGEGAFSQVYLAESRDGRQYACKVGREVKMLRREAEMLGGIYHPLFPAYEGYEETGGMGRLFMEYISGRSLGQLARFRGGISAVQAVRIAEELADGMRYLHERQPVILYRDLKPDNIMVCEDGHIRVIDLGCACRQDEQDGSRVGTPGFAPPEQLAAGGRAGIYSDVYGLGKTMQSVITQVSGTRKEMAVKAGCWEERKCRQRMERMIVECTREDFRQRPQDMISVTNILTGKRKREEGVICEKNIWESSYKNSCSLSLI